MATIKVIFIMRNSSFFEKLFLDNASRWYRQVTANVCHVCSWKKNGMAVIVVLTQNGIKLNKIYQFKENDLKKLNSNLFVEGN